MNNKKTTWLSRNPKKAGFLISLIIFAIALFIVDRLVKFASPPSKQGTPEIVRAVILREHHPGLTKTINPTDHYLESTDNLIDQDYPFRIDNNGFLLPHNNHKDPDETIVFIGGSTTECMYVTENNRFPYLAGQILEKSTGEKINSFNAAGAGNTLIHSLEILLNKIIPMNPDHVVIMHAINDYSMLAYDHTYWPVGTPRSGLITINDYFPKTVKPTFIWHLKGLFRSIYPNFYQKLYDVKDRLLNPPKPLEPHDEWAGRRHMIKERDFEFMQKEFRWALQILVKTCKSHDITPILMTQANRYKANPDEFIVKSMSKLLDAGIEYNIFKSEYDRFNEIVRETASENNIPLIDLANLVPQEKEYMYDVMHFNDTGSIYVSEIIAEKLAEIISK